MQQIIDDYSEQLLRIAYYFTKNLHAAEDIVQDVFIKFSQSNYKEIGQLRAYLTKLTINRSKDYLKSWTYRKIQFQEHLPTIVFSQKDKMIQKELRSTIGEAILALPIKYREVIILYYYEDLHTADIAALLQQPESTIRTRLRRAREKLRPVLSNEWEDLYEG
ncbi:sigma-70 family RNA polymerase sigma factor [Lysinibacillus sp. 3P01SB]|uniref:sigma-70 family RNA polymerase sigma factor n=1 Tax=Lysinibacillus sp. 3P01SB TaxID=3132284 RepID=UPI0039A5F5B0